MFTFPKSVMKLLFLGLVLLSGSASLASPHRGAAYIFRRNGTSWSQQWKLVAMDGAAGDQFGVSVALDGETALVGAYQANVGGNSNQGKVYFFERQGLVQLYLPLIVQSE